MRETEKKLMLRVIKKRMEARETFDEIISDYPKLTEDEVTELEKQLNNQ